jgi:hypothetical protein
MKKSVVSIVIIVSIITITIVAVMSTRPWLLLNNTPKFTAKFKGLNIALIKPTFTAAAYQVLLRPFKYTPSRTKEYYIRPKSALKPSIQSIDEIIIGIHHRLLN